jgi:hypothetical protein
MGRPPSLNLRGVCIYLYWPEQVRRELVDVAHGAVDDDIVLEHRADRLHHAGLLAPSGLHLHQNVRAVIEVVRCVVLEQKVQPAPLEQPRVHVREAVVVRSVECPHAPVLQRPRIGGVPDNIRHLRNRYVFECFPYACPEPVLVQSSFLVEKWETRTTIRHLVVADLDPLRGERPEPTPEVTRLAVKHFDDAFVVAIGTTRDGSCPFGTEAAKALAVHAKRIARSLDNLVVRDGGIARLEEPEARAVPDALAVVIHSVVAEAVAVVDVGLSAALDRAPGRRACEKQNAAGLFSLNVSVCLS